LPLILPEDGLLWANRSNDIAFAPGLPALFLDRDGVIVEEVHFLSRPEDARLVPGAGPAIAAVNRAGFPVVVVTNQSGIGRRLFDWPEFVEVQAAINAQLAAAGARWDAVIACGYDPPRNPGMADHPWRKPGPGMLLEGKKMLDLDLARSWIVGDRVTDLHAGANAGIAGGWLVMTGYGEEHARRFDEDRAGWQEKGFAAQTVPSAVEAIEEFLRRVR
jgi:D-glycero-D-manno-heptose 1,7-bisphosphate phosphatase